MLGRGYISCLPKILLFTYHFCSKSADNRGLFTQQVSFGKTKALMCFVCVYFIVELLKIKANVG